MTAGLFMRFKKNRIAIIDYNLGNLFSIKNALISLGWNPEITADKECIRNAEVIILPGVGAFAHAMSNLTNLNLVDPILDHIRSGKPFMGICLGMQLLLSESSEFGYHQGLGIIEGSVKKFEASNRKIIVPQIGWNKITQPSEGKWKNTPLKNVSDHAFMYFVHSYYALPTNQEVVLSISQYEGIEYCSSVLYKNIFATQFHPETSGQTGVDIYSDFLKHMNI